MKVLLKPAGFLAVIALLLLNTSAVAAKKKPKQATQWYVKTTLSVAHPSNGTVINDTRSGVFGQLDNSQAGYDRFDVPVWAGTANSPAAIVFIQGDNFEDQAGEYLSDYHSTREKADSWSFTVRSTLQSSEVTLNWQGLFTLTTDQNGAFTESLSADHKLLRKLKLIDLETGEVIKAVKRQKGKTTINSYQFSMEDFTSRQFRWVLGDVEPGHFEMESRAAELKSKSPSSLQLRQTEAANALKAGGRFGSPPDGGAQ